MSQPLIVITNDDGIRAKGIRALIEVAQNFGELLIVAPDKAQSGMGHAITVNNIIRVEKSPIFPELNAFSCTGTPVDCVKMAAYLAKDRKPDLVLSGVNHGANTSLNVLYSGTMSAAVEGFIEGIPSIGFSLDNFDADADFEPSKLFLEKIIRTTLETKFENGVCLNVNIPAVATEGIHGIKVCRAAEAQWEDEFMERTDNFGRHYYWLAGHFENKDNGEDTDIWAVKNNFVSVVPIQHDLTAFDQIEEIKNIKF